MMELIIGMGIVGFLLAYLFFQGEDKTHLLLRILMLGALFGIFVLIGKAGLDSNTSCELLVNASVVDGNSTSFTYEPVCYQITQSNTASIFYNITLWIVRLISLYLVIYFIYEVFKWFARILSGKYGRTKKE
jgi:hypothetical protein